MAEIVAETVVDTGLVVTVNVAVVAFARTVILEGTCAAAVLLLDNVTTAPVAGAGPLRVTVAIDVFPPVTAFGFRLTEFSTVAETVRVVVRVTP